MSSTAASVPQRILHLTLIVAATLPTYGIGRAGALPWSLKPDMAFFTRATKHTLSSSSSSSSNHTHQDTPSINAVIMGRRTWESIPSKFRPLKQRANYIVTSRGLDASDTAKTKEGTPAPQTASSLEQALRMAAEADGPRVGSAIVIGGAALYRTALESGLAERVLLTKIKREYECDTFFPLDMDGHEALSQGWRKADAQRWAEVTGEQAADSEITTDEGIELEFCLYERG